jgi:DNA topoisomerase I
VALRPSTPEQHETSPPPRYSERTLVERLEEEGIGRPSTYASIISTLESREYVRKESRRFFATPLGEVVVSFLKAHFHEIVDIGFTSRMEDTLDEIAAGDEDWSATVRRFLDEVDTWVRERKPERPRLPLHHPADCPECGAPMERVFSGKSKQWFASCSRWPDCEGRCRWRRTARSGARARARARRACAALSAASRWWPEMGDTAPSTAASTTRSARGSATSSTG